MITQDCEGYIYVANTDGVMIFNGFTWNLVKMPRNQRPRAVFKGDDCKIYTAGYKFFGYINTEDKNEPTYIGVADSLLLESNQEFWNVFGNKDAILFQSFSDIYSYDFQNVEKIETPTNIMLGNSIKGEVFVPRIEQGLYQLIDGKLVFIEATKELPSKSKIAGISFDEEGLIIATQIYGVYKLIGNNLIEIRSPLIEKLKDEQINKITRLTNGDYAIGTILNGIYVTEDFQAVKYHLNQSNGLSNNTVLSLFVDSGGNLWAGLDKGIDLILINNGDRYFYDRQGVLGNVFTSIYYDNRLFVGSNQGLFHYNKNGSFDIVDNSQGQVWSLLEIDGDLLVGHNNGTYVLKGNRLALVSGVTGGWCMVPVGERQILQSTYTGLILLQKKDREWVLEHRITDGSVLIENFVVMDSTVFGYHTYYGITEISLDSGLREVQNINYHHYLDTTLIDDKVHFLQSEEYPVIKNKRDYYKFENGQWGRMERSNLELEQRYPLLKIQLSYLDRCSDISKYEQISNVDFNLPKGIDRPAIVSFDEGYISLGLNEMGDGRELQNVLLDYALVNGKYYGAKNIAQMELKPFQNDVTFQLTGKNFGGMPEFAYYKLKGWDDKWHPITQNGLLSFINLDHGKYELILGNGNKETAVVGFSIMPHWYESSLGLVIYIVIIGLGFWLLNIRNKIKLRQQKEKLQIEKERGIESERIKAKSEKLERELIYKSKMLANSTLTLVQKNKMLNELKTVVINETKKSGKDFPDRQKMLNLINKNINNDDEWEIFEQNFAEVHQDFLQKLKTEYPDITSSELRLAAYIKMNLSSKEIAPLMNISVRSVENKRYRLRKKMEIDHDSNLKEKLVRL